MSFFPSFSAIAQPKMRQEGFHLPSPTPSSGNPPSPPPGPFDLFLSHSSNLQQGPAQGNVHGSSGPNSGSSSNSAYPSLALPDAYSRTSAVDLTDELTMSLLNSSSGTSNERATHTPSPHFPDPARGPLTPGTDSSQHQHQHSHMHNIFDISAPSSSHFSLANVGGHAFSLPQSSARPDLPPLSQPASLATSHLFDHHNGHGQQHHDLHNFGLSAGRDSFPTHFNSTIPPLSLTHDSHAGGEMNDPLAPFTPTSVSSMPTRDSASPRPANSAGNRRESRSRSRVRAGSTSTSNSQPVNSAGGPMRTTKSMSRRRDSFTLPPHLSHSHSHHHSHSHTLNGHLNSLPSPPLPSVGSTGSGAGHANRPSAIMIPDHSQSGGALSPLGSMGQLGGALSPLLAGQASGWFGVNGSSTTSNGVNNGIHGHDFGLPTPESVGSRHAGFNHFSTSVGSMSSLGMGISPKDTVSKDPLSKDDAPLDPASKQAALVSEKRRRRRESHNAVERRRRDNINEKISELATLIPEVLLSPNPGADKDKDREEDEKGESDAGASGTATATAANAKSTAKEKASAAEKSAAAAAAAAAAAQDGSVKANKGMILRRSVDYIRYLQVLVGAQAARNRALERKLTQNGLSSSFADPGDELLFADAAAQLPLADVFEIGEGMGISLDGGFGPSPVGSVLGAKEALQKLNADAALSTLEPMPMDEDMDMDMDFEGSGLVNGFGHGHDEIAKSTMNGLGHSNESGSPEGQEGAEVTHATTPSSSDDASAPASSPHALSSSQDLSSTRDQSTDASEDWDLSHSQSPTSEREKERGRRGRPPAAPSEGGSVGARVGRRRSKLVSVKEEGAGMEI